MKLTKDNDRGPYTDYSGSVILADGVVLDIRLTMVEGGPPYLSIGIGDESEIGDPVELELTQDQADRILAESLV